MNDQNSNPKLIDDSAQQRRPLFVDMLVPMPAFDPVADAIRNEGFTHRTDYITNGENDCMEDDN